MWESPGCAGRVSLRLVEDLETWSSIVRPRGLVRRGESFTLPLVAAVRHWGWLEEAERLVRGQGGECVWPSGGDGQVACLSDTTPFNDEVTIWVRRHVSTRALLCFALHLVDCAADRAPPLGELFYRMNAPCGVRRVRRSA